MSAPTDPAGLPPAAIEAIRKVEKEREEFLSIVAHELKTPLTPLKSVAQLIRLRLRKARSGESVLDLGSLERSLLIIERQVDRMDRLVTDLLEVSRIGRGRFDGIGIAADEAGRLGREAFVRGRRADGFAGVGIGLYLWRLIAEGHGGRLELESAGEDKGTTARLVLPREPTAS